MPDLQPRSPDDGPQPPFNNPGFMSMDDGHSDSAALREDAAMSKHPHRAAAIAKVREDYARRGDPLDDMPDEAVAQFWVTKHVEFGMARRAAAHAIRDALPERLRRLLGG